MDDTGTVTFQRFEWQAKLALRLLGLLLVVDGVQARHLRARLEPVHNACLASNRFKNFRANVSHFITELGWDRPVDRRTSQMKPRSLMCRHEGSSTAGAEEKLSSNAAR
jgi:hypothetical protein